MHRRRFLLTLAFPALAAACGGGQPTPSLMGGSDGVLEVARANGAAAFARAVERAGLAEQLSGDGPYTLFAPSDAALRAAGLPGDPEALQGLVGRHVVPGMVSSSFMTGLEMNHLTAAGDTLAVDGTAQPIRVEAARVLRADLPARNGVVHLVDRVLAP